MIKNGYKRNFVFFLFGNVTGIRIFWYVSVAEKLLLYLSASWVEVRISGFERVSSSENIVELPEGFLREHHVLLVWLICIVFHYQEEFWGSHAPQNCSVSSEFLPDSLHALICHPGSLVEMLAPVLYFLSALLEADCSVVDSSLIVAEGAFKAWNLPASRGCLSLKL